MTILAYAPKTRRVPLCLVTTAGHLSLVVGISSLGILEMFDEKKDNFHGGTE